MAQGGGAGGGGLGGSSETLEQARLLGPTFLGDVFWDAEAKVVVGRASGESNVDYGELYFDQTAHAFVFDSTKAGSGTVRPMSWRFAGAEKMGLSPAGRLDVLGAVAVDMLDGTAYYECGDAASAAVSSSGHGRLRYNNSTKTWQMSMDGGAYQDISAGAANAWVLGGNAFGADGVFGTNDTRPLIVRTDTVEQFRVAPAGELFYGVTAPLPSLETSYTNRWRFSKEVTGVVGGNLAMIVDNPSNGPVAYSTILACNDLGVGLSLTAVGSGWTDAPGIGINANDCVLAVNTAKDIDPSPLPTMVYLSGLIDQRWMTNSGGGNAEVMRLKTNGDLLMGTVANNDPGHYLIDAVRSQNSYDFMAIENPTNGTSAVCGFLGNAAGRFGTLSVTPPAYSVSDGRGAESVVLENVNGSGGIVLMTDTASPVIVKLNTTEYARFAGDGSGFLSSADTAGSIGKSGARWGDIWVVNTHFGDINLDDDAMDSHWTIREAKFEDENPRKLYALDRVSGKKYTFQLQEAA